MGLVFHFLFARIFLKDRWQKRNIGERMDCLLSNQGIPKVKAIFSNIKYLVIN
ncbi:hypothetical protein [Leptospira harrisiae]|uniref:hypothetical protein n=1 Tax=Leptospira harrisiae TaxID=2023189 RepID=UPI0013FE07F8|nr:hypothetical protein [Leptospira harrisiae]